MAKNSTIDYYLSNGKITDLTKYREEIAGITTNPNYISQIVQGLITHVSWCKFYHFTPVDERIYYSMFMSDLLDRIFEYDQRSLCHPRRPEDRVLACCREFACLTCAIMREKGIPARVRAGFASYLGWEGTFEDHWITEYWNGTQWIQIDSQIDPVQLSCLEQWGMNRVKFYDGSVYDPTGLEPHRLRRCDFATAGQVWLWCRKNQLDPMNCGFQENHGLWYIRRQLLMDFICLNKIELALRYFENQPKNSIDYWKLAFKSDSELTKDEIQLLDLIAELSLDPEANFEKIRDIYQTEQPLQAPHRIYERE